ncbi:MAG TPA: SWIM zinc finger family protein [Polyangiaceae bacterium]|nr:SWIM zinc finger family protein [Polyangiaceae bacterium]
MSPWDRDTWKPQGPKKPPPARGIKTTNAGSTWWGQRWIAALNEVLRGDEGRLARGRTYARAGRTHDLAVEQGKVTARVTGSRDTPYKVTLKLAQLTDSEWNAAIAAMAAKAQFAAALLAGEMPKDIDGAFQATGASLFPKRREDLVTSCSCPDWGDPCKHVAATHYVLGEALDRDPFLLFELRGRKKTQVLDALRAVRGGAAESQTPPAASGVALGPLNAADYDRPRAALPSFTFSFDAPANHGAVLRQLGTPAAWSGKAPPAEALAPLLRSAADAARRIALSERVEAAAPESPDRKPAPRSRKRRRGRGAP